MTTLPPIPPQSSLKKLHVRECNITSLPDNFWSLGLEEVDFSKNKGEQINLRLSEKKVEQSQSLAKMKKKKKKKMNKKKNKKKKEEERRRRKRRRRR